MPANVLVFLDFAIGSKPGGRVVFELFNDVAPKAAENFRGLCTGEYGESVRLRRPLTFKNSKIFNVVRGQFLAGGDIENNDGTGGESIYGGFFEDENFMRRHAQAGVLSTARRLGHENEPHGNSSQWVVTLRRCPQLDNRDHVAFGQVAQGIEVLRAIENIPLDFSGLPRVAVVITSCGQLGRKLRQRKDDPRAQMRSQVGELMATLNVPELERTTRPELTVLVGGAVAAENATETISAGGVTIFAPSGLYKKDGENEENEENEEENEDEENEFSALVAALPAGNPLANEFAMLQEEMKRARDENAEFVAEELKKPTDAKENAEFQLRKYKELLKEVDKKLIGTVLDEDEEEDVKKYGKEAREAWEQKGGYLNETAESVQRRCDKRELKKKRAKESYGWGNFSLDSQYAAHEKRTKNMAFNEFAYEQQIAQLGDKFYDPTTDLVSTSFIPTEAAKNRLAAHVTENKNNREQFSRRRAEFVDYETVSHINERNRTFNQKLEKTYGTQFEMP